jgi:TRAP-type uncharacterized transport system fused permease subunit
MDDKLQSETQGDEKAADFVFEGPSAEEIDAVLRKYDKASDFRVFSGKALTLLTFLLFAFSMFQLTTATVLNLDALILRSLHLGFGLCLVYIYYPGSSKWSRKKTQPHRFGAGSYGAFRLPLSGSQLQGHCCCAQGW